MENRTHPSGLTCSGTTPWSAHSKVSKEDSRAAPPLSSVNFVKRCFVFEQKMEELSGCSHNSKTNAGQKCVVNNLIETLSDMKFQIHTYKVIDPNNF